MSNAELDPSHIMQVGTGFWPSKTLLSAVELDLFSQLGGESMSGEQVGERLALHPRAIYDFLDALVELGFLEREGDGTTAAIATAPRRRRSSMSNAQPMSAVSSRCSTPGSTGSGVI